MFCILTDRQERDARRHFISPSRNSSVEAERRETETAWRHSHPSAAMLTAADQRKPRRRQSFYGRNNELFAIRFLLSEHRRQAGMMSITRKSQILTEKWDLLCVYTVD